MTTNEMWSSATNWGSAVFGGSTSASPVNGTAAVTSTPVSKAEPASLGGGGDGAGGAAAAAAGSGVAQGGGSAGSAEAAALAARLAALEKRLEGKDDPDLEELFHLDPPASAGGAAGDKDANEADAKGKGPGCPPSMLLWGGPIQPTTGQNLWTFIVNFFDGVTTAHGINQSFKTDNGIIRRLFWLGAFGGGIAGLFYFVIDAILAYMDAIYSTNSYVDSHGPLLPMVSVCNLSPIRCGCTAFYHPSILDASDDVLKRVLPFVCSSVLAFQLGAWKPDSHLLEDALSYVVLDKTRENMRAFESKKVGMVNCDIPKTDYTADNIAAALIAGNLSLSQIYTYAGWSDRNRLIRGCMAIDTDPTSSTAGSKVSCMGDEWWGPASYDPDYGACQNFNPCHGFPVGSTCSSDSDCGHEADDTLSGGSCNTATYRCECSRCLKGSGCKLAQQPSAGLGNGIRIMANVAPDQDPPLFSASRARWTNGMLVYLHTQHDAGNVGAGFTVAQGTSNSIAIAQKSFADMEYPFTNCSEYVNVHESVCQSRCLKRLQAIECCSLSVPVIVKGKQPPVLATTPTGLPNNVTDPLLACNMFDPEIASCFDEQVHRVADGLACIGGSVGFSTPYYSFKTRADWYEGQDVSSDSQVAQQEQQSNKIQKQCVWRLNQDATIEAKYGQECKAPGDCGSSVSGGTAGQCVQAYRAYCPNKCDSYRYDADAIISAPISDAAAQLIAADELALTTDQWVAAAVKPIRRWKPSCAHPAVQELNVTYPECFSNEHAQSMVRSSYTILNLDYLNYDLTVTETVEGIALSTLMGTVGGNLGMFVGMSMMTVVEWLELLAFAVLALPFFILGIPMPMFVRKEESEEPVEEVATAQPSGGSDDISTHEALAILRKIKNITERRRGQMTSVSAELTILHAKP